MTESQSTDLLNYGQIATIRFPPSWVEGARPQFEGGPGTRSFREFHPQADVDAKLCFYYRGMPTSVESGQSFLAVLSEPPHTLSEGEIASLEEILRGKGVSHWFEMTTARTESISEKTVLVVRGRWLREEQDVLALHVAADDSGSVVQEIYFQAPSELFDRYLKAAKSILKSIAWK